MKQTHERTPKRTPDAVPAVVEPVKTRHHADAAAVSMLCRSRDGKIDLSVETTHERDVWRRADDLAGPSPTPLIKSLATTVAICELDLRYRQAINGPLTAHVYRDHQVALNSSTRRYLASCKMLALAQRLNLPSIQVNVGMNQIVSN